MDVLLLPTAGTTYTRMAVAADPVGLNANLGYYTNFVNLMDLAAIAIPAGFTPRGLPFGVSLIAPAFSDRALLTLAGRVLDEPVQEPAVAPGCVAIAVVGAHLSGQPLNFQLTDRGARLMRTCQTSSEYQLFALPGTTPLKPAWSGPRDSVAAASRSNSGRCPSSTSGRSSRRSRLRSASAASSSRPRVGEGIHL
jgi:allophanate hydrolase